MSIYSVLQHRATVTRSTTTLVNGAPVYAWNVVSVRTPVLYSTDNTEFDPAWTATQRREADQRGTLFATATADIKPGDRLTITRPAMMAMTLEVLPDPSTVLALHSASHKEWQVRQVGA